jgi:hypothetical protein
MSKLFETQEDLDAERAAIIRFAGFTNSIPYKLPMESMADYVLARDGYARAIVEIKCRTNKSDQYDEYMLGEKKYTALCNWQSMGFAPILLISWPDAMGYVKVPVEHKISMQGRNDRGASITADKVVLIDIKHFKMLPD